MTSDEALVTFAAAGDDASYDELHRRHAQAAWGLAQAITRDDVTALAAVEKAMPAVFAAIDRGSYPAGLPVRWAVLVATRAAAVSMLHGSTWTGSPNNRDVVDRAFSGLPECWRSALWLVEVERLVPVDAGRPLGVPPDDAAALVGRARAGFVDRYVRLAGAGRGEQCRVILPLLPGLAAHGLAPHQVAMVDQHLAECRPCHGSSIDLSQLGDALRGIALKAPPLALKAPAKSRSATRPPLAARAVPALAAVIAAVLGFSSIAALSGGVATPAQQVASPIEARVAVRDPGAVRSLVSPIAAPADVGFEAPSLPPAPIAAPEQGNILVAMSAEVGPVPAHLPVDEAPAPAAGPTAKRAERAAGAAPDAGADQAPEPTATPVPPPADQPDDAGTADGAGHGSPPPPTSTEPPPPTSTEPAPAPAEEPAPVVASAELAGVVGVSVTVDPGTSRPIGLDTSTPGALVGL